MISFSKALFLFSLLSTPTFGEVDGSSTCHSGTKIPGNFHGNSPTGSLVDGDYQVLIDGQPLSLSETNVLSSGTHTITVKQNAGTYMGFYIWANNANALKTSTDNSVQGGTQWRAGGNTVSCSGQKSGLTHKSSSGKTQSTGQLVMPSSGSIVIDVQMMPGITTYYHSRLVLRVEGSATPPPGTSPTNLPTTSRMYDDFDFSMDSEDSEDEGGDRGSSYSSARAIGNAISVMAFSLSSIFFIT